MDVSIVIVNYNTLSLIKDCLQSIKKETKCIQYEIIIVDNASTDGSPDFIRDNFPQIRLIRSSQNIGFGQANNLGVKYASGKYLLLLNPDTILLNNAPSLLYQYMEQHQDQKIGAIGGLLLDSDKKLTYSYGYFPSIKTEIFAKIINRYTIKSEIKKVRSVDYIIGADLFLSKELFNDMNGFDPHFFIYCEETDLQKRIDNAGLKRLIIPAAKTIHLTGGCFSNNEVTYYRFSSYQKSLNYYTTKHFCRVHRLLFGITCALVRLNLFLPAKTKKWTWHERLSAYMESVQFS